LMKQLISLKKLSGFMMRKKNEGVLNRLKGFRLKARRPAYAGERVRH
jgi:hypothetical protein